MGFVKHFLFNAWAGILIVSSFFILEKVFDPSAGGSGYGWLWQLSLGLAPTVACLLMLAKQLAYPHVFRTASRTYLFSAAWCVWLLHRYAWGWIGPLGVAAFWAPDFMWTLNLASTFSLLASLGLYAVKGNLSLSNAVHLWAKRQPWYKVLMRNRASVIAGGPNFSSFMSVAEARRALPRNKGTMLLGIPWEPKPLAFDITRMIVGALVGTALRAILFFVPVSVPKSSPKQVDALYYPASEGATLVIGPTRTGKGTSYAIPNLLANRQTFVNTDPKGELFAMTAWARINRLGRRCVPIDPYNVLATGTYNPSSRPAREIGEWISEHRGRCNPFDFILPTREYFESSIRALVDPLFPAGKGAGSDDFWNDSGKAKLAGLFAWACDSDTWFDGSPFPPEKRNPSVAVDLLSLNQTDLMLLLDHMSGNVGKSIRGFDKVGLGWAERIGNQMATMQKSEKEWSGLVSTILTKLNWVDDPMRTCMARSGISCGYTGPDRVFVEDESAFDPIDFSRFWDGSTDVFFIVPDEQLEMLGPWLRMMMCGLANVIKSNGNLTDGRQFNLLFDELAQIGGINELKKMVAYAAGKGIHPIMIFQGISQIIEQYGPEGMKTIMGNTFAKIFLGANDIETAELLQKYMGDTTVITTTVSTSGGSDKADAGSVSVSNSATATKLMSLQNILGTSKDFGFAVLAREGQVLFYEKSHYFNDPAFIENGEAVYPVPNPFDQARIAEWKASKG